MTHEAGETARSFIDALKEQPLSLALVLMNLALIGYLYYESIEINKQRTSEQTLLYQNRREVALLLARCTWPQGTPLPKEFDSEH
jgi:hypothetical protein